jgi:peptidoglycan/xylan/chitin deacetylase (PgdA/CDA1 family)
MTNPGRIREAQTPSQRARRPRAAAAPVPPVALARRRRAGAALLLVALIALIAVAIASSGGASPGARARLAASGRQLHAGRLRGARAGAAGMRAGAPAPGAGPPAPISAQEGEAAIDHVLSYTPAVVEGAHHGDEVALTFDDGPGPYTVRLVHTLDALHVHATFFAIGEMERWFEEGTLEELHAGDVIGDHTETHPPLATLPAGQQREELLEQMQRIEVLGAPRPRLFRPPYGSFDPTTFRELRRLRLLMVLWSCDTSDYTLPGVQAIVQRALAGAHPGAIILMHDGGGDRSETIAALPAIVRGLRKRGLYPVTIPQLLRDDPPPPGQPIPTSLAGD